MKLILNPDIARSMKSKSMLAAARESHIGYPTFSNMAHGRWNTRALDVLARFLEVCGIDPAKLPDMRFGDIFIVETKDDKPSE